MDIVNVVYSDDCCVSEINSFPIISESERQSTVACAEIYFQKVIKEINEDVTDGEIEIALEDGYYDYNCGDKKVEIIWSNNNQK